MIATAWGRSAIAACVAVAVLFAARVALIRDVGRPNLEFFPDMARSPAAQAQMGGAPTPGGLTSLALPAGVVPRGHEAFRYGATPEEALRAGAEVANPFDAGDATVAKRGAEVYGRFCAVCHGPRGEGDGAAVLHGMVQPPSLHAARAADMKDGQMFHIVTRGQGNMASYAVQIPPDDRWRAILHVRAIQRGGAK